MSKLIRILAVLGATKLASSALGYVKNSAAFPRPLKWGAAAVLAILAVRR